MKIILQTEAQNLSEREIAINYHNLINLFTKIGSVKNQFVKTKAKLANK